MTPTEDILNRLLDKYENSRHLMEPGSSHRRVMLHRLKKELPEYRYDEDVSIRDAYHSAALKLEEKGLVSLTWLEGNLLLSEIVLNLDAIDRAYEEAGRIHPRVYAARITEMVHRELLDVSVPWIKNWEKKICEDAELRMKFPAFCKDEIGMLRDLLTAFREYDSLQKNVTMRAFSSKCYHDTKYFERNVRNYFLSIAKAYDEEFDSVCEGDEIGVREQLAILGIYARPELYELAGNCKIQTENGVIDLGAVPGSGLAIPSTLVEDIAGVTFESIKYITFIENKTNYDEYLISERTSDEVVIYHGGFLSPIKKKLIKIVAEDAPSSAIFRFWADIDLGGFRMFRKLQRIVPSLVPMRMSGEDVRKYHQDGLVRSDDYFSVLLQEAREGLYPMFSDAIEEITKYKVTIEQETFLNEEEGSVI